MGLPTSRSAAYFGPFSEASLLKMIRSILFNCPCERPCFSFPHQLPPHHCFFMSQPQEVELSLWKGKWLPGIKTIWVNYLFLKPGNLTHPPHSCFIEEEKTIGLGPCICKYVYLVISAETLWVQVIFVVSSSYFVQTLVYKCSKMRRYAPLGKTSLLITH